MANGEKVENPWIEKRGKGEEPGRERDRILARRRRLSEYKNLCMLNGEIQNWWEAYFLQEPIEGFSSHT